MDVIANNIANLGTAGFKRESIVFSEYLMPKAEMDMSGDSRDLSYVEDFATIHDHSAGPVEQTGNEFDVAVEGDGYLVVQTPDGERYTRNGQFKLDATGQLVTSEGFPVLGDGGPITFAENETDVSIATDGTISTSVGQKGRLRLVAFDDPRALRPVGASTFETDEAPQPAETAKLRQGVYEKSNVQPVTEITRMIEVQRAYESVARMMARDDEMRSDAIDKLASVPA